MNLDFLDSLDFLDHRDHRCPCTGPLLHALRSADSPFRPPVFRQFAWITWINLDLPGFAQIVVRSSTARRPISIPPKQSPPPLLSVFSEKSAVQTGLIWLDQPGFTLIVPTSWTPARLRLHSLLAADSPFRSPFPVSALPFAPFAPFCGHPPARSALLARNALVTLFPNDAPPASRSVFLALATALMARMRPCNCSFRRSVSNHQHVRRAVRHGDGSRDQIGAANAPSPLLFDPPLKGQFVWLSTRSGSFAPAEVLPLGLTYRISLQKELKDAAGHEVKAELKETPSTPPMLIKGIEQIIYFNNEDASAVPNTSCSLIRTFARRMPPSSEVCQCRRRRGRGQCPPGA